MKLISLPRTLIALFALTLVACDSREAKTAVETVEEAVQTTQANAEAANKSSEPAPVADEPAPVADEPAPVADEPAPLADDPAPLADDPAPATDNTANEPAKETGPVTAATKQSLMEEYLEGGHYEVLAEAQPVSTGNKIEVRELFWYSCPHCKTLEPAIEKWLQSDKPENAELVPMPAVLGGSWALLARAYYVFEALGLVDELHEKMFVAIHDKKQRFSSEEQIADWAATHGADRQMVLDTFDSFAVDTKLRYAELMTQRYGINSVPAVVVDGKYRTNVSLAGGVGELFKVINYLVSLAASERTVAPN